tara:strand:+ start:1348 stop:1659 length:312 start_codon:yes stop_codon:yes gene_type:complete
MVNSCRAGKEVVRVVRLCDVSGLERLQRSCLKYWCNLGIILLRSSILPPLKCGRLVLGIVSGFTISLRLGFVDVAKLFSVPGFLHVFEFVKGCELPRVCVAKK